MLIHYCNNPDLSDVLLRLLVNLTNPAMLFFRVELPKDNAGRRTYLDLLEIGHSYKEAFGSMTSVWKVLVTRLKKIIDIEVGERSEEQNLILERILVLTRNVLQVPANPQCEKRADNDISVHDQIIVALHDSGMLELILYILSSKYENQYYLHALEITYLIFREQKVETLADSSVQRSAAEKYADEQALVTALKVEKSKFLQNVPPARHSRFGGTYVYRNMKSVSDRDLICHQPLERVVQKDLSRDKKKIKANFRLARDEDKYERVSAFSVRIVLREFCLEILTSAFNNLVRQVRRVLERNHVNGEGSGHDQSYLLWAMRFFLEFNRLNGFNLEHVSEIMSGGTIHWICNQIQNDFEMISSDKKRKIHWNRRLQLGIQAYREFLYSLQILDSHDDEDIKALAAKLKSNVFYVVEYREIILQLLLSYNENSFTRYVGC
jgi:timeless